MGCPEGASEVSKRRLRARSLLYSRAIEGSSSRTRTPRAWPVLCCVPRSYWRPPSRWPRSALEVVEVETSAVTADELSNASSSVVPTLEVVATVPRVTNAPRTSTDPNVTTTTAREQAAKSGRPEATVGHDNQTTALTPSSWCWDGRCEDRRPCTAARGCFGRRSRRIAAALRVDLPSVPHRSAAHGNDPTVFTPRSGPREPRACGS